MRKLKFELRITLVYLLVGGFWIAFSDKILNNMINDIGLMTRIQTFKGWFYVIITAILFYLFLKKHLTHLRKTENELEIHQNNLQLLVEEKTKELDAAIAELQTINNQLSEKNNIINKQNSELIETLDQLKQTQNQLLLAEKMASLNILTSGFAHEINNPLNYILGGLTGLENYFRQSGNQNNEQTDLFIDSIKTGVARASSLVSELNQLSYRKDTFRDDCTLHPLIENCLLLLKDRLRPNVSVKKTFTENEIVIWGNIRQLHQLFINILLNAIQSICNEGSILITTSTKNDLCTVEITDSGCGISKDHLSKITDPFFTTKEPGEGTGLGLSIAYNIIQTHGGQIDFKSQINKGMTVTITLPVKKLSDV